MEKTDRPFIIGICGGTCSGKSKIVKILIENLKQKVSDLKVTVIMLVIIFTKKKKKILLYYS